MPEAVRPREAPGAAGVEGAEPGAWARAEPGGGKEGWTPERVGADPLDVSTEGVKVGLLLSVRRPEGCIQARCPGSGA